MSSDAFNYSICFSVFSLFLLKSQGIPMLMLCPGPLVCCGLRVFAEMLIVAQMKWPHLSLTNCKPQTHLYI